jgi:hypothetical protein
MGILVLCWTSPLETEGKETVERASAGVAVGGLPIATDS